MVDYILLRIVRSFAHLFITDMVYYILYITILRKHKVYLTIQQILYHLKKKSLYLSFDKSYFEKLIFMTTKILIRYWQ